MNGVVKGMLLALMLMYIMSPLDMCPGPFDDLIILLVGMMAHKALSGSARS